MSANVVQLDAWRDPDGVLRQAKPGNPLKLQGWAALGWIAQTDKRDALRIYARLGLHPILIHGLEADGRCTCGTPDCNDSAGKHPVFNGWQAAELDVDALDRALIKNWRYSLGLRMGRQPSGITLVTIDVDGGRDLLAPLEAELGPLPPTLTATSGKGLHLVYRLRDGARTPKNKVKLAPGVDVRSEGGQIVCAPSFHRNGQKYRWIDIREPEVLP
jgi:putative DNA primase/helicase